MFGTASLVNEQNYAKRTIMGVQWDIKSQDDLTPGGVATVAVMVCRLCSIVGLHLEQYHRQFFWSHLILNLGQWAIIQKLTITDSFTHTRRF